jgi:hypothetical protein
MLLESNDVFIIISEAIGLSAGANSSLRSRSGFTFVLIVSPELTLGSLADTGESESAPRRKNSSFVKNSTFNHPASPADLRFELGKICRKPFICRHPPQVTLLVRTRPNFWHCNCLNGAP